MDTLEFINEIKWPVVWLIGFIVLIIYRGPFGQLISNLRKGRFSNRKGEGLEVDLEASPGPQQLPEPEPQEEHLEVQDSIVDNPDASPDSGESSTSWIELESQGRQQEARTAALAEAAQIDPNDANKVRFRTWLEAQAARLQSKFDFGGAKRAFTELLADHPESLMTYYVYFDVLRQAGDSAEVYRLIDGHKGTGPDHLQLLLLKAQYLVQDGEVAEADSIINELTSQTDEVDVRARAHILRARLLKGSAPADAKKWLLEAYKLAPTSTLVLNEIAGLFDDMKDSKAALYVRRKIVEVDANVFYYWGYLGNAYVAANLLSHSLQAYETALALESTESAWIVANIGNLYNNARLYHRAIESLERAVKLEPTNQYAISRLATALANKEAEDKQISDIMQEVGLLVTKNSFG